MALRLQPTVQEAKLSSKLRRQPQEDLHDQVNLKLSMVTYELITIRFGGMAARNSPMGRNAASAFKKSLKLSFDLNSASINYIV